MDFVIPKTYLNLIMSSQNRKLLQMVKVVRKLYKITKVAERLVAEAANY